MAVAALNQPSAADPYWVVEAQPLPESAPYPENDCELYKISFQDAERVGTGQPPGVSDETRRGWLPTVEPLTIEAYKDDIQDEFVRTSANYTTPFKDALVSDRQEFDRRRMIDYYYCAGVGVLKFGTGKSYDNRLRTIGEEIKRSLAKILGNCRGSGAGEAKVVTCPVIVREGALQDVERAWRKKYATANRDKESDRSTLEGWTVAPEEQMARALIGSVGLYTRPADTIDNELETLRQGLGQVCKLTKNAAPGIRSRLAAVEAVCVAFAQFTQVVMQ